MYLFFAFLFLWIAALRRTSVRYFFFEFYIFSFWIFPMIRLTAFTSRYLEVSFKRGAVGGKTLIFQKRMLQVAVVTPHCVMVVLPTFLFERRPSQNQRKHWQLTHYLDLIWMTKRRGATYFWHLEKLMKIKKRKKILLVISEIIDRSKMKSSKKYFIFSSACYMIIWLMISPKIFWKKIHFENMTAGFPLLRQNELR